MERSLRKNLVELLDRLEVETRRFTAMLRSGLYGQQEIKECEEKLREIQKEIEAQKEILPVTFNLQGFVF
jgi:alpha-galactosidase